MMRSSISSILQMILILLAAAILNISYAQTTQIIFNSETGDSIGQGQRQTFTAADGTFTAERNLDNGVSIVFTENNTNTRWSLDFAASNDAELAPGAYEGATRYPFQAQTEPGLSVSGDGRGCNTLTGRFDVRGVVYGTGNEILQFAADFEQHCEGRTPALFGSVRFNSSVSSPDQDSDGVLDTFDNCIADANPDQADADSDGIGDVCDPETPVTIPSVVGLSQSAAIIALQAAGFEVNVERRFDSRVSAGDIISQTPRGGTQAALGSTVSIVVSNGPIPQIEIPDVIGETLEQAESILQEAGFSVTVSTIFDSSQPLDVVISQSPTAGSLVNQGSSIRIVFNQMPVADLTIVPDVVGLLVNEARILLQDAGLDVLVLIQPSSLVPPATLISQNPVANAEVAEGTTVTVFIASESSGSVWVAPLNLER